VTSAHATAQPSAKRPDVVGAPRQRTVAAAATVAAFALGAGIGGFMAGRNRHRDGVDEGLHDAVGGFVRARGALGARAAAVATVGAFGAFGTALACTPSPNNALGIKGVGELPTNGAAAAIANAVLDALADDGVTHIELPMTPPRVWEAIRDAGARRRA
jgi:hypothetical protein